MSTEGEQKAHTALLAAAEKMICAIEADPALLYSDFGTFLKLLLDEIRSIFGPSDLLDSLLARVRSVRSENPERPPPLSGFAAALAVKRRATRAKPKGATHGPGAT
jgi:hypothetical protein